MKGLLERMRWESILLVRNNLVTVSVVITLIYIGLFQLIKLLGEVELISIFMVLNDPAVIGMLFVGVTIIFEREQRTLQALQVAPMNLHHYLLAKILLLSVLGTLCGLAMAMGSVGTAFSGGHFIAGLLLTSIGFANLGLLLVASARRFIDFALWMGLVFVVLLLPFANWFDWLELPLMEIFPVEHAIRILAYAYGLSLSPLPWGSYLYLLIFALGTYWMAYFRFQKSSAS